MDACKVGGVTVPPYIEQVGWGRGEGNRGRESKRMNSFRVAMATEKWMNEWHDGGVEVRECEIDLVAEHGVASVTGLSSADAVQCPAYPGVSGAPALPGKALIYVSPFSEQKADFEGDSECVHVCGTGSDH